MCAHKGVRHLAEKSSCPCSRKVAAFSDCHRCLSRVLGIKCKLPQGSWGPKSWLLPWGSPHSLSQSPQALSLACPVPSTGADIHHPPTDSSLPPQRGPREGASSSPLHGSLSPSQHTTSSRLSLHTLSNSSVSVERSRKWAASLNSCFCLGHYPDSVHSHSFLCSFNKKH